MINVTKSFMPPLEEYEKYLKEIWNNAWLTNDGPLLKELAGKLEEYLNLEKLSLVSNGTMALQLAINALEIQEGEIITTPFTFVATTNSIIWEGCTPRFVDINKKDFCIDVNKIEKAITKNTKAILAVHVFGYPCDVDKIEEIARKYAIKVIYDGAHALGVRYKNKSLLSYGDVATCSFHATKLFHTIEGGVCIAKEQEVCKKINAIYKFGDVNGTYKYNGTNAKMTEFQAAMGLVNIKYIDDIIEERKKISELYDELLKGIIDRPKPKEGLEYNYSYYPVVFESEKILLETIKRLNQNDIFPRRYFYPSLNTLSFLKNVQKCEVSEDVSKRILCLPLYMGLEKEDVVKICSIIKECKI